VARLSLITCTEKL